MNTSSKLKVVVFGSINIDIFIKLNRQPLVGETMMADTVKTGYGGKVNQPTISHKFRVQIKLSAVPDLMLTLLC
jgi:sugar/nucleoside kinase (ribokinase family)